MGRHLVLGNGNILICFDEKGRLRDFYYHYIGHENHIGDGCVHKIGILVDGRFSWVSDEEWEISLDYQNKTMVSRVSAINQDLGVELNFKDAVYNEENILVRNILVKNLTDRDLQVKVFLHQQFRIYDTYQRDTAYFSPEDNTIVHYEGRRVFVVGAKTDFGSFNDYSIGNYGIEGKAGTWKDAEDGLLENNPIEHGPVDSVIDFPFNLGAKKEHEIDYWICAAKSIEDGKKMHRMVLRKTPEHIIQTTGNFWKAWANKSPHDTSSLGKKIDDLYRKSLLVIRTHTGNEGGIIASGDSGMLQYGKDTYAYVWPRDGAFIATSLNKAGYANITKRFFEFCNDVISKDGYFYHKYRSDKSVGSSWHPWVRNGQASLPIQEDETALVIWALWDYYQRTLDLEFIEKIYNSLIKKSGNFMCEYIDQETELPMSSYDLWEQKYGSSTFTSSAVCQALICAGEFAKLLGKKEDSDKYKKTASKIKSSIIKRLYNNDIDYFNKLLIKESDEVYYDTTVDLSSFYGIFKFSVLDVDDDLLKKSYKTLQERLKCRTSVGGFIRYEKDDYHISGPDSFGNPWFITTLWVAQYEIELAKNKKELSKVKEKLNWVVDNALETGILSEQLMDNSGKPVSATPLAWSHAEFVTTVVDFLEKKKKLNK
ncbi:MAG: glycoside hydrolase family 15 protein [Candidatus Moraniibacteriota bacterium]